MIRFAAIAFLLLLPLVAIAEGFGLKQGGTGRVLVYGDSMSDLGNPTSCEWCDPLTDAGLQVWAMSRGGRRSYYDPITDPASWCVSATYLDCNLFGEYVMDYLDGECRVSETRWSGDGGGSTCSQDLPHSAQDVDVIFLGVNDLRNVTVSSYLTTYLSQSIAAFNIMLNASSSAGHAVVMVLGPPGFEITQPDPLDTDAKLVILQTQLRFMCESRPKCVVADVYSHYRDIETKYGSQAMYDMYSNCDAGPGDTDCIHPIDGPTALGIMPNDEMGEIILKAVYSAHEKRRVIEDVPVGGGSDWDSMTWDTDDWG